MKERHLLMVATHEMNVADGTLGLETGLNRNAPELELFYFYKW